MALEPSTGQGFPLLLTKLRIPPRRGVQVSRPHLVQKLNGAARLGQPLVLLSAPAGCGKTTLLAEWIPQAQQCVTWLSLSEEDNDAVRFWSYFIAALQQLQSNLGRGAMAMLQAPDAPAQEAFLHTLLNDIAAFGEPFSIVLDDFHVIEDMAIQRAVGALLDHAPAGMQLVISTRLDPALPLPRLRVRRELRELRAADLAFALEESADFLQAVMRLEISPEAARALAERTEGWVAGLQLAALSIQNSADPAAFMEAFTGSHRHILGYLSEEVLDQQLLSVQDFLMQTAILDRLCGPLCDALTGRSDSAAMLEKLEADNLFTSRLDASGEWFRYHQLFADALRRRLQRDRAGDAEQLHRRASAWFAAEGSWEMALEHAVQGNDIEAAAEILDGVVEALFRSGRVQTLLHWVAALPPESLQRRPRTCLFYSWTLSRDGKYQEAERTLEMLEEALAEGRAAASDTERDEAEGMLAALRASMSGLHGDLETTAQLARTALEKLPESARLWRGLAVAYTGTAELLNGQVQAADRAYRQASPHLNAANSRYELLIVDWRRARLLMLEGQLSKAMQLLEAVLKQAAAWGLAQRPVTAYAHVDLGDITREQNDLEAAEEYLAYGIARLEEEGSATVLMEGTIALARLRQAQGQQGAALAAMQDAEWVAARAHLPQQFMAALEGHRARLWLQQGMVTAVKSWAEGWQGRTPDDVQEIVFLTLARLLLTQDAAQEAVRLLEEIRKRAMAGGRAARVLEADMLHALAEKQLGHSNAAMARLAPVLAAAERQGYVRLFADEGAPMATLLRHAGSEGRAPQVVRGLLAAMEGSSQGSVQPLVDPLTARELEVLGLLVQGLSNLEIASDLVVSRATVKKHVENIYRKLDVHSRTQAAARANELGLT